MLLSVKKPNAIQVFIFIVVSTYFQPFLCDIFLLANLLVQTSYGVLYKIYIFFIYLIYFYQDFYYPNCECLDIHLLFIRRFLNTYFE